MNNDITHPDFKPGDTPYCVVGHEVLNGTINWQKTLVDILLSPDYDESIETLAEEIGVEPNVLHHLLQVNKPIGLSFKAGCKLLTIHDRLMV